MRIEFETNRRATDQQALARTNVRLFIVSAIVVCVLSVVAVVTVAIVVPMNTVLISTVLGVMTPISMALLAAGLHGIGVGIDGRMTQLIDTVAQKERLVGTIEGLTENPNVNLEKTKGKPA